MHTRASTSQRNVSAAKGSLCPTEFDGRLMRVCVTWTQLHVNHLITVRSSSINPVVAMRRNREAARWGAGAGLMILEDEDVDFLFIPAGDPKTWQNKSLPGDPNYLVGANCVSVLIDHF